MNTVTDEAGNPVRLRTCVGCWRPIYPKDEWVTMTPAQRSKGAREWSGDLCNSCRRSSWREPEPGEPWHPEICATCGRECVTLGQWRRASLRERQELRDEGLTFIQSKSRCSACCSREDRRARRQNIA